MNKILITNNHSYDVTMVSNYFIDHYMSDANDAQLKVYLFLLRAQNNNGSFCIADIADKFNHTEKEIIRSISYWEKKNLLSVTYDDNKNITSISLQKIEIEIDKSHTPIVTIVPPLQSTNSDDKIFKKPDYSLDELKAFKNADNTSALIFIAEQYLGKTLSANDIRSLLFISSTLAFSFDLLDYLLQYCVDRNKRDFRYIEKVAISWAEQEIKTPKQATEVSSKYDKSVYSVMNALGKQNNPTKTELDFIQRWNKEYHFTNDIILTACERTVLATDKHRFEYADKILSRWKSAGVKHVDDIKTLDTSFYSNKSQKTQTSQKNKFNQFTQNDYDFEALERELLHN
ncbi:MAG: DnaD domain protein [Lachnospiraceae bacterium]